MSREVDPCAAWQEDLSALLDAELEPGRRAEVEAHLEGCARCSARLAALRRVDHLLSSAPLPDLPEGLAEKVLHRAARPARPRRRRLLAPVFATLAAAAALALYLTLRPHPGSGPPTAPEPPVAVEPAEPPGAEIPAAEHPPPTLIAVPLPPPALPPAPEPEVPRFELELEAPQLLLAGIEPAEPASGESRLAEADLEAAAPEDLAIVLFGAERPDDFDVISNLEVLERLVSLERGRG